MDAQSPSHISHSLLGIWGGLARSIGMCYRNESPQSRGAVGKWETISTNAKDNKG